VRQHQRGLRARIWVSSRSTNRNQDTRACRTKTSTIEHIEHSICLLSLCPSCRKFCYWSSQELKEHIDPGGHSSPTASPQGGGTKEKVDPHEGNPRYQKHQKTHKNEGAKTFPSSKRRCKGRFVTSTRRRIFWSNFEIDLTFTTPQTIRICAQIWTPFQKFRRRSQDGLDPTKGFPP